MLNPFQLIDPWMMIGGSAMLLLIFLAVFVWNSPRRETFSSPKKPNLQMASTPAALDSTHETLSSR